MFLHHLRSFVFFTGLPFCFHFHCHFLFPVPLFTSASCVFIVFVFSSPLLPFPFLFSCPIFNVFRVCLHRVAIIVLPTPHLYLPSLPSRYSFSLLPFASRLILSIILNLSSKQRFTCSSVRFLLSSFSPPRDSASLSLSILQH